MAEPENLVLAALREHRAALEKRFDANERRIDKLRDELMDHLDDNHQKLLMAIGYTILDRTGDLLQKIEKLEERVTDLERRPQ
jgi:Mg2+ and Co2+ transporter CorA